jgi:hypothetical protein
VERSGNGMNTENKEIKENKRNYGDKMEAWIRKQHMRRANGLSISDTITRSKDGEEG